MVPERLFLEATHNTSPISEVSPNEAPTGTSVYEKIPKMQLQYYLLIALLLVRHNGIYTQEVFRISDKVTTCSFLLSGFIEGLCDKTFKIVKRETTPIMIDKLAPKDLRLHVNGQSQKMSYERLRRVRRQVATECCSQACTIGNLILYCSDEAKLVQEDPDIFT